MKFFVGIIGIIFSLFAGLYAWLMLGGLAMTHASLDDAFITFSFGWWIYYMVASLPVLSSFSMFIGGISAFFSANTSYKCFRFGAICSLIIILFGWMPELIPFAIHCILGFIIWVIK